MKGIAAVALLAAIVLACSADRPAPWLTDEAQAFQRARDTHRGVVIDFTATWSMPSVETSHHLDALAGELDRDFVRLRIDVSNESDRVAELRERYRAPTLPAVIFVDADGTVLGRFTQTLDEPAARRAMLDAARQRKR